LNQLISPDKVIIVRSIAGNVESQGFAFAGYSQIITSELYRTLGVPFTVGVSVALLGGTVLFWIKTGISYVAFHRTVFSSHKIKRKNGNHTENQSTEFKKTKSSSENS
jgi:hypothetical protein